MAHLNRMPKKINACVLLFIILIFLLPSLLFAENEPNNSIETANSMDLNGSVSGTFSASDYSYDYFKLVVPSDGKLTVSVSADAGLCVGMYLMNETGFYTLATNGTCGTENYSTTLTVNNLAAGTYYIEAGNGGYGNYTLSNTFIASSYLSDQEFNDNIETALEFIPNTAMTGHLGFRNVQTDYYDYYKLTTTSDGKLQLYIEPDPTLCIDLTIYNETGFFALHYNGYCSMPSHSDTLVINNLAAGTYMIATSAVGYGSYKISNEFVGTLLTNDLENNDNIASANQLPLNTAMTGHLGFRNVQTDYYDYYKLTTTSDGKLKLYIEPDPTLCIDLTIYNETGFFALYYNGYCSAQSHSDTLIINNLTAGTYMIATSAVGYGSYQISNEFLSTVLPNDLEPNDNLASALNLPGNSEMTGHLGYRNILTDEYDYYKISTSVGGRLKVMVDADSTLCVNLNLINEDGNIYLASNGSCGNESHTDSMVIDNLASGNYYVLAAGVGYGAYTISTSLGFVSGLKDEINSDIEIFPNPVKKELYVATNGLNVAGIKIYDMTGRIQLIKNKNFSGELMKIDLKSLRSGCYIIEFKNENHSFKQLFTKE